MCQLPTKIAPSILQLQKGILEALTDQVYTRPQHCHATERREA